MNTESDELTSEELVVNFCGDLLAAAANEYFVIDLLQRQPGIWHSVSAIIAGRKISHSLAPPSSLDDIFVAWMNAPVDVDAGWAIVIFQLYSDAGLHGFTAPYDRDRLVREGKLL